MAKVKRRGLTEACGTPLYVAPEIISGVAYGTAVDVWSLGIVIFIMLGGYHPFAARKQVEMFRAIRKGSVTYDPLFWSRISDPAKDLIHRCLVVEPATRLNIDQVRAHPWLAGEDSAFEKFDVSGNLKQLRLFNARRKLKGMILAAIATNTLADIAATVRKHIKARNT